jgi:UDP-2-acetamido-2,6-beta-L-arabino-hexul-4-ose reductase
MKIFVTGAQGFIGRNLLAWLAHMPEVQAVGFDRDNTPAELEAGLATADCVIHLAGVNRPETVDEFRTGNVDLTARIGDVLAANGRAVPILFASSTQAELDNPYGVSKRQAEAALAAYARRSGARVVVYRLTNVFGKWCRPNYNSVVATFCHNVAHDLPITISDPHKEVAFVHVDDVIRALWEEVARGAPGAAGRGPRPAGQAAGEVVYREAGPVYPVTLGRLAELLHAFRRSRQTLVVPDFSDAFSHKLYGTFLSYLAPDDFAYDLTKRSDPRGSLAEFVKSPPFGQIFVSRTHPGITRGNHFHHLKTEKFLVLEGQAIIRFRHIDSDEVIEYPVDGEMYRVVDIPPGYTHSIENIGEGTLVTLFWASEIFDPERPDTIWQEV